MGKEYAKRPRLEGTSAADRGGALDCIRSKVTKLNKRVHQRLSNDDLRTSVTVCYRALMWSKPLPT
jgi:hypothetical protein